MASLKYDIPLLDRNTRFSLWQVKMRAVLAQMDLDDALLGFDKMPANWTTEEKQRKDRKALSQIHLHLSNNILQDVLKEKTAAALWLKLEQLCMTKSLTSKLHLKQRLYSHRMAEGGSLEDHLAVFKEIVADLETLEVKYDVEDLALILLCSLPASYSSFRDTILYSRDTLTIEDAYDALFSKEKMKHLVGATTSSDGDALVSHGDRRRGRPKVNFSNVYCFYCKKKGHVKRDCDKLQAKGNLVANNRGQSSNSDDANITEYLSDGGDVMVTVVSDVESKPDEEWILDSACSHHVCPNRDLFQTYEAVKQGGVVMGNNQSCRVAGIGRVRLRLQDGTIRTLDQVRHVPDLKRNLISLSTLDAKGYKFSGGGGALKVRKGAQVVLEGRMKSHLYILQGSAEPVKRHLDKFSTVVEIQFGTVPLVTDSGSVQNIAQGSVGDFALPPITADSLCSHTSVGLMERRYSVGDVCNAFGIVEGDSSSKGPSDHASGVDSATGSASTLFGQ